MSMSLAVSLALLSSSLIALEKNCEGHTEIDTLGVVIIKILKQMVYITRIVILHTLVPI